MSFAEPLFSLLRGGYEEIRVHGEIALVEGSVEPLAGWVSTERSSALPARSLLNPLQFCATGLPESEGELTLSRTAALGSISATAPQVAELSRWHAESPLLPYLQLPAALPLDPLHRARLVDAGRGPSALYHPCFSKHMAILAACVQHEWPLATYLSQDHPYHAELVRELSPYLDAAPRELTFVCDGCGLPTPVLRTREIARFYRALWSAREGALARIRRAMLAHPEWIGGSERADTRLMQLNPGRLIAKEGADGLLALAGHGPPETGAFGLVVKLAAGHQPGFAALAVQSFLAARGLVPVERAAPRQEVLWHTHPGRQRRSPVDLSPELHDGIAVWPGDVPYRRQLTTELTPSASSDPGWQLTVSSIHTTLHVGAHADAPNHFDAGGTGIDRAPLTTYRGPCQVIECSKAPGARITPEDIQSSSILAPRVLFKTSSYPDPDRFNPNFCALSPEIVRWLARHGVILIGIDTPSVDPFDDALLLTHRATRACGLAILEGLDLSDASTGLYELVALPLRLRGGDASPVRATLWPLR